ncbi:MAG: flagellar assembly peptidoglycan hydrolase FlgJ [Motiliproteus sp.]|nr:flagellar assembly peptidoglycan hydrolase FlgJ [Motiliproteus sp.]MCW9051990.1 flagellar assembly peptidoglycan hydrolase FlgJ [Motiliproteus sp.]
MVSKDLSFRSYADLQGLDSLKLKSKNNDPEALQAVAKQFESLFLNMLLKNMRQANESFGKGSYFDSNQTRFYQNMLDQQMSLTLSENNSIGLSEVLVRQLSPKSSLEEPGKVNTDFGGPDQQRRVFNQALERTAEAAVKAAEKNSQSGESDALPELRPGDFVDAIKAVEAELIGDPIPVEQVLAKLQPTVSAPVAEQLPPRFDTPEAFIRDLYPIAQRVAGDLGVDPKVLVAQAALETGWGKHLPNTNDGSSSFNLFGIKADQRWGGDATLVNTLEYRDGVAVREKAAFRAYGSYEESMRDYVDFIRGNPRYQKALEQAGDGPAYLQQLQAAGYATDPNYASKIAGIVDGELLQSALAGIKES